MKFSNGTELDFFPPGFFVAIVKNGEGVPEIINKVVFESLETMIEDKLVLSATSASCHGKYFVISIDIKHDPQGGVIETFDPVTMAKIGEYRTRDNINVKHYGFLNSLHWTEI